VEVIVEIPRGTRNKYEYDERAGRIRLERQLPASVTYPVDYGYIPGTLAADGDPLDALVLLDEPAVPGCIVTALPLGVLRVVDKGRADPKILCVLADRREQEVRRDLEDLPAHQLEEIGHFFTVYKDLDEGEEVRVDGFAGAEEAAEEIARARRRHAGPTWEPPPLGRHDRQ
jgi:inorganic pyrophosphatase